MKASQFVQGEKKNKQKNPTKKNQEKTSGNAWSVAFVLHVSSEMYSFPNTGYLLSGSYSKKSCRRLTMLASYILNLLLMKKKVKHY